MSPTFTYTVDFEADRERYLTDNVLQRTGGPTLEVAPGNRPDVLVVSKQRERPLRYTSAAVDMNALEDLIYEGAGLQRV